MKAIGIFQFQTAGGRKFSIYADDQKAAEQAALVWRDKHTPKSDISYNFRIK